MKKIFYVLLLTAITLQGQTTGVNKLRIAANPEKTTAPRVMVQENNGDVGYVAKSSFETAIPLGTTSQYWRGDKTWQTLPSGGTWGSIIGSITHQADLQNALNAKQNNIAFLGFNSLNSTMWNYGKGGFVNSTSFGSNALASNTAGNGNTAIGYSALASNTMGLDNTAIGFNALSGNTTGHRNIAIGVNTLTGISSNSVAIGHYALSGNTIGGNNIGIGYFALSNNTFGTNNIAIGNFSGTDAVYNITSHSNQIVIGSNSHTNAYIKIGWTVTSDARDKTNFAPVPHGLNFVNSLQPIKYQFRESRTTNVPVGDVKYGFKAQDILALEGSNPVIIDAKDPNNLKYTEGNMIPVLVNAIKELSQKVTALEAEVQILKNN